MYCSPNFFEPIKYNNQWRVQIFIHQRQISFLDGLKYFNQGQNHTQKAQKPVP